MKRLLIAASLAAAAALGVSACAVTSGQESVGQYVDDASITTSVKARFADDPTVSAMRISVETLKGVVQLSGFAASQAEKDKAADIARRVKGVSQVQNMIVVRAATQ